MSGIQFIDIVSNLGLPIALVAFLMWQNDRREQRLAKEQKEREEQQLERERALAERLDKMEQYQQTVLHDLHERCITCIQDNTAALHEIGSGGRELR